MRPLICMWALTATLVSTAWAQSAAEADAKRLLARFDGEPTVNQVQAAALSYASMHPEIFSALQSRSRIQALLPELKVKLSKGTFEQSRGVTAFSSNVAEKTNATETLDDDLKVEGEVKWKLSELVFNPRETAVVKENRYTAKERQRMLQTVTQLYFERRRAQIDLMTGPPNDAAARALAELKIAELTAELDAVTGGGFSRMVSGAQ